MIHAPYGLFGEKNTLRHKLYVYYIIIPEEAQL